MGASGDIKCACVALANGLWLHRSGMRAPLQRLALGPTGGLDWHCWEQISHVHWMFYINCPHHMPLDRLTSALLSACYPSTPPPSHVHTLASAPVLLSSVILSPIPPLLPANHYFFSPHLSSLSCSVLYRCALQWSFTSSYQLHHQMYIFQSAPKFLFDKSLILRILTFQYKVIVRVTFPLKMIYLDLWHNLPSRLILSTFLIKKDLNDA